MNLSINGNGVTNSENILPDTFYYNNSTQKFNRQIIRNSFSGTYETKLDSTSSLKIMADGGTDHKINSEYDYSEALASDSSVVNQNTRTVNTVSNNRLSTATCSGERSWASRPYPVAKHPGKLYQ